MNTCFVITNERCVILIRLIQKWFDRGYPNDLKSNNYVMEGKYSLFKMRCSFGNINKTKVFVHYSHFEPSEIIYMYDIQMSLNLLTPYLFLPFFAHFSCFTLLLILFFWFFCFCFCGWLQVMFVQDYFSRYF